MTNESIVWRSELTEDMVSHLLIIDVERLFSELDDAVLNICQSYDVSGVGNPANGGEK